jgi:hypothetical protein
MKLLPERNLLIEIIVEYFEGRNPITDKSNDEVYGGEGIGEA